MKLYLISALLAVAVAESRPPYHPPPVYKPAYAPAYKPAYAPAHKPAYGYEDYSKPKPYAFDYAVNDHYNGAVFSQNEHGDDYGNVEGYYSVNLPDGRIQHVKYVANDYGNNAEVTYEGEAQYPEYHPQPYKPAPYKPAPYKPAPYKPAPYKPAPYKPAYNPAYPAPSYKPVYKPAYKPAYPAPPYKPAYPAPAPAYKPYNHY